MDLEARVTQYAGEAKSPWYSGQADHNFDSTSYIQSRNLSTAPWARSCSADRKWMSASNIGVELDDGRGKFLSSVALYDVPKAEDYA